MEEDIDIGQDQMRLLVNNILLTIYGSVQVLYKHFFFGGVGGSNQKSVPFLGIGPVGPGRGIIDCIRFEQHLCLNVVLLKITILRL